MPIARHVPIGASLTLERRIASLGQRDGAAWDADLDSQADRLLPLGRAPGRLAVLQAHGLHRHAAAPPAQPIDWSRHSRAVVARARALVRACGQAGGRTEGRAPTYAYAYAYGPKAAVEHRWERTYAGA